MQHSVVVITGPSGVGKTSIINTLLDKIPNSARLVPTTTRKPRPKEQNGKDYFFVTCNQFETMIENREFLEYKQNYDNYYGISKAQLNGLLDRYSTVFIGGIDTRGARSIKQILPQAVTIFLLPDSITNLRKHLEKRPSKDDMETRLEQAIGKIGQAGDFDYQVINVEGQLDQTADKITGIIFNRL